MEIERQAEDAQKHAIVLAEQAKKAQEEAEKAMKALEELNKKKKASVPKPTTTPVRAQPSHAPAKTVTPPPPSKPVGKPKAKDTPKLKPVVPKQVLPPQPAKAPSTLKPSTPSTPPKKDLKKSTGQK